MIDPRPARALLITLAVVTTMAIGASRAFAQVAMPNPKEMSGSVLPVSDLPVGTVAVRLIKGNFDKNVVGHPVDFLVDGNKRTIKTDDSGRAQVTGLARGARVRAVAVVEGERLESQEALVETSGLRIVLVATDPEIEARAAKDRELASAPPVKGIVVLGPESRVLAMMSDDRLNIYYLLEIVNSARTPVDIGGPLVFDLPREARSSVVLEGSTPKATANGPRITVTGPFAPGSTSVQAAFELPYSGPVARLRQTWPAALPQLTVLVQQIGGLTVSSPQIASTRDVSDQGQALILGTGPGIPAGQMLSLDIAGLPYHARWPRNLALTLASMIMAAGLVAAMTPRRRAV
jgi:hypothetical protein